MLNEEIKKLLDCIKKSNHIFLVTHRTPDGDAIGSLLAMQKVLSSLNKKTTCFCVNQPAENFNYLEGINKIENQPENLKNNYDLGILLDCADLKITKIEEQIRNINFKFGLANVDHHYTNPQYGNINIVIPQASSTAEIIYQIMKIAHIKIEASVATALLTGIITDTGNFAYRSTTRQAIDIASKLLSIGADFSDIAKANIYNKTIKILKLWGMVLKKISFNKELSMVTTGIFKEDLNNLGLNEEASEGISNYLNNLSSKIKFSVLLKQYEADKVKGSLRTTHDDVDVAKIAQTFGGGGHRKAAGFEINGQLTFTNGQWQIIKSQ